MRIRDRLRRAWRWAGALLAPPSPIRRASPSAVFLSATAAQPPRFPRHRERDAVGDAVAVGEITLRLWPVGNLVVLASGDAEAEDALVSLLAHADPAVRSAASARLDQLRGARPAAA
jgi:hypothetical protein